MSFAATLLTANLDPLRQRLLFHPLWVGIEQGTLPRETLCVFTLQDWWLVREAYRLDALAIAEVPDLDLQDLLLAKLIPKIGDYRLLLRSVRRLASHEPILMRWSRSRAAWRSPISSPGCSPTARCRRKSRQLVPARIFSSRFASVLAQHS